jgi:hypothetical protein
VRGGKSFLVLLLVAGAIAAYVYFVESKRDPSESADTAKRDKVWTLDTAKIEELEVKSADGDVTKLKKNGQAWQIVSPEPMDADQDAVSTVLSAISSLESTKVVDENAASLAGFELEPARIRVSARLAGETTPKVLDLGTKTPTGADLYARVDGQKKVLLVGGSLEDQVNRSTFDLRDKTVLKFDRDKADSLKVEPASGAALSLVKKTSEQWRLAVPVDAQADFSVVDGIVSKLSQARMKAVAASDGTKELKKYGLDKPQAVVTVGAGSSRASLALGAKTPDGALYARDLTRPMVFTVETALLDDVNKKAADLRQKMLFEFRSFTAISIDIVHGAETFSFVKQTAPVAASPNPANTPPPAETWKQTKPAAKDVDQTKITDFLVNVANLKADTFADRAAASGDDYVITVKFGEPKAPQEERVTFRKSGTTVHALRAGEPGAAVAPTADFDKVVSGLKDLTGGK